jgi:hypothetical protein
MMHVNRAPAPEHFARLVGNPGGAFLRSTPKPTEAQWRNHAYWSRVQCDLYDAYDGICNFSCHWIPRVTGSITVEHYKPKSKYPNKAYVWSNFRLMCGPLNGRKGDYEDVLDPFRVTDGTFIIEFPSLLVKPAPNLTRYMAGRVMATIARLQLNDEGTCIKARERYVKQYCQGLIDFAHVAREAPFIAYELTRQGLEDAIKGIMGYPPATP